MSLARRMLDPSMQPAESSEPEIGWMARVREGDMEAFKLLVEMHRPESLERSARCSDQTPSRRIWLNRFLFGSGNRHRAISRRQSSRPGCFASLATWSSTSSDENATLQISQKTSSNRSNVREKEPDRVLLEGELQRAIQEAINQLPESQRLAIILRRFEEMPYEEIAKVMGTSVPAVKSILFRGPRRTEGAVGEVPRLGHSTFRVQRSTFDVRELIPVRPNPPRARARFFLCFPR